MAAILAFSCHAVSAQELVFPERWKKGLTEVPPIYSEDTVTIRILGDIMMHESQIRNAKEGETYDFSTYFSHIQDEIRLADIAIANMEFTLAGEPYSGYPCFSAPDEYADYLADCGFDVFLAFGNDLESAGIACVFLVHGVAEFRSKFGAAGKAELVFGAGCGFNVGHVTCRNCLFFSVFTAFTGAGVFFKTVFRIFSKLSGV